MDVSSQGPRATQKPSKRQRSQPVDDLQSRTASQAPENAEVEPNSEEEVEEDVAPSKKKARPVAVPVRAPSSRSKKPSSVASSAGGRTRSTRAASQALFLASEDEGNRPQPRGQTRTRATASVSKKRGRQIIEEDEEYEEFDLGSAAVDREDEAVPGDSDGEETLRTQDSTRPTRNIATGSKRARKVIQDDDSDDAVFKGFKGRKKKKF